MAVGKGKRADGEDEHGDLPGELVEPTGERRGQRLHPAHQRADAANLGVLPGRHHHAARLTKAHHRARIGHAAAIADGGGVGHRLGVLVHRQRFAGQRRFAHAQVLDAQQAQVGRHLGAGFEQHDVARHQVGGVNLMPLATAQHRGMTGQHGPHRLQRLLGLALLHKTDQGIDQHHADDHAGVHIVFEQKGNDPRDQQHVDQRVMELQRQPQPCTARTGHRQAVGAVLRQTRARLRIAQPAGGIHLEPLLHLAGRRGVPLRRRAGDERGFGFHTRSMRLNGAAAASHESTLAQADDRGLVPHQDCRRGRAATTCHIRARGLIRSLPANFVAPLFRRTA